MNVYSCIILTALLAGWLLESVAETLNIGALRPDVPPAMHDVYDEDAYGKSQHYTRAKTLFGIVRRTFDLALLLLFWFAGGFNWLDAFARGVPVIAMKRATAGLPVEAVCRVVANGDAGALARATAELMEAPSFTRTQTEEALRYLASEHSASAHCSGLDRLLGSANRRRATQPARRRRAEPEFQAR